MTNNKQQTAVEWFANKIDYLIPFVSDEHAKYLHSLKEQAKEMEWDQINNAYLQGFNDNDCNPHEDTFNLYYYNETYGGND